jgi:large subunit ribosomal protein L31
MKKNFHPEINEIEARCVCGASFITLSTAKEIVTSFCSACHPFYTKKQQFADAEGRIDKFKRKYGDKKYIS